LPLPDRVKDYISLPKVNGYKALHTTVLTNNNQIVEVQIVTKEMYHDNEYGIASH
jgi:GTP pyrophosphokinase